MSLLEKVLSKAEKEHDLLKHPYVGTEHLLLAILSYDNDLTKKLKEYKLTYNTFKRKLKEIIGEGTNKSPYILYTPMLRKVLSIAETNSETKENISYEDLFSAILEANEGIAIRILELMNIDIKDICIFNDYIQIDDDIIISHREKEIEDILQILMRKNKCNPLLIGEAGVGKTAIVEEIQRRLLKNQVPSILNGYRIINVDISSLVAGTKYRGDFEKKINDLLKSVENKKTILFIDEIHTLVHAGGAEGAISAGDIIKPYLARGKVKCIGATTINEYHNYFEIDEALNRRFQQVYISETNYLTTIEILNNIKGSYEKYHKLIISEEIINEIVQVANKYISNKKNPDKSIELLDSCCTNAKFLEQSIVTTNNLYSVFKNRYGLDLSNNYIRNILDNKTVLLANIDNINKLKCISNNIIYIDGKNYNDDEDIYNLLGNPLIKNSNYLLKKIIDVPVGVIVIINYNKLLKELIGKMINSRHIIDNYGHNLSLENYIIIMEERKDNNVIGFINDYNIEDSIKYIELNDKELLPSI